MLPSILNPAQKTKLLPKTLYVVFKYQSKANFRIGHALKFRLGVYAEPILPVRSELPIPPTLGRMLQRELQVSFYHDNNPRSSTI